MIAMGFRENIKKEVQIKFGGNFSKFAKALGISNSYLNEILNDKQRWNEDFLNRVATLLGVPSYRLLADEPVLPYSQIKRHEAPAEGLLLKIFENPISLGPDSIISDIIPDDYFFFPQKLLPRGHASEPDRIVAVRTTGISMKTTIMPGSIAIIDRADRTPQRGGIYVFWLSDRYTVTIKRLIKLDPRGYGIIDGDNQNPEDRETEELKDFPMIIDLRGEEQGEPWPICGRVVWAINRLAEESESK